MINRLVVEKALEKDPAERYQTMREMVVDLRRMARQSGEALAAGSWRRARGLQWAAALIVIAIVAGTVMILFRTRAMPPSGFPSKEAVAALPRARLISEQSVYPGPHPSVYAFTRMTSQRNIYRVPVP